MLRPATTALLKSNEPTCSANFLNHCCRFAFFFTRVNAFSPEKYSDRSSSRPLASDLYLSQRSSLVESKCCKRFLSCSSNCAVFVIRSSKASTPTAFRICSRYLLCIVVRWSRNQRRATLQSRTQCIRTRILLMTNGSFSTPLVRYFRSLALRVFTAVANRSVTSVTFCLFKMLSRASRAALYGSQACDKSTANPIWKGTTQLSLKCLSTISRIIDCSFSRTVGAK
mmetsp:Transcript_28833/g.46271  ORF Transcript_28833/g.46271 Transcript_28833/m.46271 type:complete len:226 (-) Transcript_28833:365-1042(-)